MHHSHRSAPEWAYWKRLAGTGRCVPFKHKDTKVTKNRHEGRVVPFAWVLITVDLARLISGSDARGNYVDFPLPRLRQNDQSFPAG